MSAAPQRADAPLLEVEGLELEFRTAAGTVPVIRDLHLGLQAGRTLGIVGESGCGKSMTALSIMRLVPSPPGRITQGRIRFHGEDLLALPEGAMRRVRGNRIGMIFQEPMTSLNPVFSIGDQIGEALRLHEGLDAAQARERGIEALQAVKIPSPERRIDEYPHQLSGGMRQRAMIAMAIACQPALLIADEPTTALDVTVQAQIFELLREVQQHTGSGLILITHDMGAIAEMADDVVVMYAGRAVETGPAREVLKRPQHPYTAGLIRCVPHLREDPGTQRVFLDEIPGMVPALSELGAGCAFAERCPQAMPRCHRETPPEFRPEAGHSAACWLLEDGVQRPDAETAAMPAGAHSPAALSPDPPRQDGQPLLSVRDLTVHFPMGRSGLLGPRSRVHAVDGVSFDVPRGSTFGLVGESGSGKSTTAQAIVRLLGPTSGSVWLDGANLTELGGKPLRRLRQRFQVVFQDPFSSLNPRVTAEAIVREPLELMGVGTAPERDRRVTELFELVGLRPEQRVLFPHQFSGGQRQRIGIARALSTQPDLIVCDEPVSALDVAIQAQILNLLLRLQHELGLTYVFIAHDLGVVQHMCDDIGVMYLGEIVERGTRRTLFRQPLHPYTWALLSAVPSADPDRAAPGERIRLAGDPPSPIDPGPGCRFASRCPFAERQCREVTPRLRPVGEDGQMVACHLVDDDGTAPHTRVTP